MNPRDLRDELRRATAEARARHAKTERELDQHDDTTPRAGDILVFPNTDALWVVLGSPTVSSRLLIAADLEPMVGSSDVATRADAACGALTLRCGFEVHCLVESLESGRRTGRIEPEDLEKARRKRSEIEVGALVASHLEQETDTDPDYQDWLEDGPARARATLLDRLGAAPEPIYANGVDGLTGGWSTPALQPSEMAQWAREEKIDPSVMRLLQHVHRVASQPHLGLPTGTDPRDLSATGWALVVPADGSPAIRDALAPLFGHRRQAAEDKTMVLEYRKGESWSAWLSRHGVAPGRALPAKVPHYLLLVGDPVEIPYEFQSVLSVEYAVGRLSFETPAEYCRYAESVIRHESERRESYNPTAVFFAPHHAFDPAGPRNTKLVESLASLATERGFQVRDLLGSDATKAALLRAFHPSSGSKPPSLFVAAGHGLVGSPSATDFRHNQGALVCQDWPSLDALDPLRHGFRGSDLDDEARVDGMIALLHASFSAGSADATDPFVADLPRRLLSHPNGGAIGGAGFLGQIWDPATNTSNSILRDLSDALLSGMPLGHAVNKLKKRYAELSAQLREMRQKMRRGATLDESEVAAIWSRRNESRDLVVLGDPAVRLSVE